MFFCNSKWCPATEKPSSVGLSAASSIWWIRRRSSIKCLTSHLRSIEHWSLSLIMYLHVSIASFSSDIVFPCKMNISLVWKLRFHVIFSLKNRSYANIPFQLMKNVRLNPNVVDVRMTIRFNYSHDGDLVFVQPIYEFIRKNRDKVVCILNINIEHWQIKKRSKPDRFIENDQSQRFAERGRTRKSMNTQHIKWDDETHRCQDEAIGDVRLDQRGEVLRRGGRRGRWNTARRLRAGVLGWLRLHILGCVSDFSRLRLCQMTGRSRNWSTNGSAHLVLLHSSWVCCHSPKLFCCG